MNRKKREIPALPLGYIVFASAFVILLLTAAFICNMTSDPLSYTGIASEILLILSGAAGGIAVRKKGGTFLQGMIFSASVFALLLLLSLIGSGNTRCYITDIVCFAVSLLSFFIPSLFRQKRHRRKR